MVCLRCMSHHMYELRPQQIVFCQASHAKLQCSLYKDHVIHWQHRQLNILIASTYIASTAWNAAVERRVHKSLTTNSVYMIV